MDFEHSLLMPRLGLRDGSGNCTGASNKLHECNAPLCDTRRGQRGFTLIELMITVGIVAILAATAVASYRSYIERSRVPVALEALIGFYMRMEQSYQDTGSYGGNACALAAPHANNFQLSCTLTAGGQGYAATATGSGVMAGYAFTINHRGERSTAAHPRGANALCWTTRGGACDT